MLPRSTIAGLLLIASGALMISCASGRAKLADGNDLDSELRLRGLDPDKIIVPYELSEEMEAWAYAQVAERYSSEEKLRVLASSLLERKELGLEYERHNTGTAAEVFESRRANCLSFTNLFVGMARVLGVPVRFLEVRNVEAYQKEGDLVMISDHVAVGYGPPQKMLVYDFAPREGEYRSVRPVSDIDAIAMFYSNRGAEEIRLGRNQEALEWLETSIALRPDFPAGWVNLGVARRRTGDEAGAEAAYQRALEIDDGESSAYHNLAALWQMRGEEQQALRLLALSTQGGGRRNPYRYLALGDLTMELGETDQAGRFYRKALRLAGEDVEIYAALGLWQLTTDRPRRAKKWLKRARRLGPENPRVLLLEQRLEHQ